MMKIDSIMACARINSYNNNQCYTYFDGEKWQSTCKGKQNDKNKTSLISFSDILSNELLKN